MSIDEATDPFGTTWFDFTRGEFVRPEDVSYDELSYEAQRLSWFGSQIYRVCFGATFALERGRDAWTVLVELDAAVTRLLATPTVERRR